MSVEIVQGKLASYGCASGVEEEQALREITQEIILAGLGRTDFFEQAGFHGGTCLRIFHGLNRFSEDMDFALREPDGSRRSVPTKPDGSFELSPYLDRVRTELLAFGYALEIDDRSCAGQAVQKAFVKDDSIGKLLRLTYRPRTGPRRKLRVKLEVDTRPPQGATYAMPVLDYPFPAAVRVFDLPSLFAGKVHALLCRHYLKGRDWYDFIWYTARRTVINYTLLSSALDQQGPWAGTRPRVDKAWCVEHLSAVIKALDWERARADVQRFLNVHELPSLKLWTREFFLTQCRKLET